MESSELPDDFKEFLRLLNSKGVEYLVVGGIAVAYHGYARATADIDVWVAMKPENADRIVAALKDFGFDVPNLSPELFLSPDRIVRMGVAPVRIEVLTTLSGVAFSDCYSQRVVGIIDGIEVNLISLDDLKRNKQAAGRTKDLADLEHLP